MPVYIYTYICNTYVCMCIYAGIYARPMCVCIYIQVMSASCKHASRLEFAVMYQCIRELIFANMRFLGIFIYMCMYKYIYICIYAIFMCLHI